MAYLSRWIEGSHHVDKSPPAGESGESLKVTIGILKELCEMSMNKSRRRIAQDI